MMDMETMSFANVMYKNLKVWMYMDMCTLYFNTGTVSYTYTNHIW